MYSAKLKKISRPLIAVLTLCLLVAMAPLLPMSGSDVDAAGGETVLTIVNGTETIKTFDAADLASLPKVTHDYSTLRNQNRFTTYGAISGPTIVSLLAAAGIDTSLFTLTTKIEFADIPEDDSPYIRFVTWNNLTEKRYYFTSSSGAIGIEVPAILALNEGDSYKKFYYGQLLGNESTSGNMVSSVDRITITPAAKLNEVTVALNANGGKSPAPSIKVRPGETYGKIAIPTRKDYKFKGWFTAAKGGAEVKSSTVVTNKNNHTIFAQWSGTNKNLKKLTASKGKLNKKFKASKTSYTLKLKKNQKSTKITATKAQSVSKVQIKVGNGKWKTAKSATVKVNKGKSKTVKIKVTSESKSVKTYTVKVKRAK